MTETTAAALAATQQAENCEMTGPHRHATAPAVVVMSGGTRLCGECAVTMLRNALATGRDFHVDPLAVTP